MTMAVGDGASSGSQAEDAAAARRPPTRRYEAKRNAIVRSAVEEMNRKGVRGMTLGDVAARLDLVPTAVIYYFKNKEELAAAAFLKGLEAYHAMIAAHADAPSDVARLTAFIHAYFEHARRVAEGGADPLPVFNDVRALDSAVVNTAYIDMFRRFRGLLAGPEALPRPHGNARPTCCSARCSGSRPGTTRSSLGTMPGPPSAWPRS